MPQKIAIASDEVGKELVKLGAIHLGFQKYDVSKLASSL